MLYGPFDYFADSRHAAGKAGGRAMCATDGGFALCDFWEAGAPRVLREFAADRGNVRSDKGRGDGVSRDVGAGDEAARFLKGARF